MSDEQEETYTYTLTLYAAGPYVGCDSEDEVPLEEYGYSDQEWDRLTDAQKDVLLNEWGEEYFWNAGFEYNAKVDK